MTVKKDAGIWVLADFKYILARLELWSAKTYTCTRPPRPSGALLTSKLDIGLGDCFGHSYYTIYGDTTSTDGSPTCLEEGCEMENGHCVRTIHAEVKAILTAAKFGICTKDATLFSVNKPCYQCSKAIIAAGINTIVYKYVVYDEERTKNILEAAGVKVIYAGE